jgi:hypothetical protein
MKCDEHQANGHWRLSQIDEVTMKINTRIVFATAIIASIITPVSAKAASGNTSTATGSASATIIAPIVLTHTSGATLNFGKFTTGSGGTVVVTSGGVGSVTGDVGFVPGSTNAADSFALTGDISRNFGITTTGGSITNGSSSMTFTTTPSAATGTTSSTGAATFTVGGTLTVGTGLVTGSYSGTYTATVQYQ